MTAAEGSVFGELSTADVHTHSTASLSGAAVATDDRATWHDSPVVSYPSSRVRLGHALLLALAWAFFGWLWLRVLHRPRAVESVQSSLELLVLLVALTTAVTWAWVVHNVALARRRDGRRTGAPSPARPQYDVLGRRLHIDEDAVPATLVVVTADDRHKRFSVRRRLDG